MVLDTVQPIAKITSKSGKYSLSLSGNINMKASYDFNGSIDHPDFIPSLISVPGGYDDQRRFYLDATTSRVEVVGAARTEKFGDVKLCLNMDMRGGDVGSYTPRVRMAYIAIMDFQLGRDYTTFCDVGSLSPNIDFQGPNVGPFIYATQIRYVKPLLEDKLVLGGAIEYQDYESSTLGDKYLYQESYMPDFIGYVQYDWSDSHLRLTGLYKSIPLYNVSSEQSLNLNAWGSQLSGSIGLCKHLKLYYSGTCGEGISNYIQDTYGAGLDATVNGASDISMNFIYGWQASAMVQLNAKTFVSSGYSVVNVEGDDSRFAADDYRQGEYAFANIFYSITPRVQLSAEYLWGSRTNNDRSRASANRVYTMVQYNF